MKSYLKIKHFSVLSDASLRNDDEGRVYYRIGFYQMS